MYTVTSATAEELAKHTVNNLVRKLTIGASDYSAFVTKWPRFKRAWNDIKPGNLSLKLDNTQKTFNFFREEPTNLRSDCTVQFGVGSDLVTYFTGKVDRVMYGEGNATLNLTDKFKQLSQRTIGTNDTPVDFTGSSYLVSDLTWYLCTSHGGFSAITSTSNPDIDYSSFLAWAAIFSADNVKIKAYFDGMKVNEALRVIGNITESAIYTSNGKVSFHRYNIADAPIDEFSPHDQVDFSLEIRDDDIINKQLVFFDYDITSKYFTKSLYYSDSNSINSYGLREEISEDRNIWYVDSASALNYAQRVITYRKEPFDRITTTTPPYGMICDVGDSVTITDSHLNFSKNFRIMGAEIDLNEASVMFEVDRSQMASGFRLDFSALDSSDILT